MAIHLPFIGYVRARGALTVRPDKTKRANTKHIDPIREFFAALEAVSISLFTAYLPSPNQISRLSNFSEILFETDCDRRPMLNQFANMKGPKSLVISTRADLFEVGVENEVVSKFASVAANTYVPILCLDDLDHPLSAARVRNAGAQLPFLLMDNQNSFRNSIENRHAQF